MVKKLSFQIFFWVGLLLFLFSFNFYLFKFREKKPTEASHRTPDQPCLLSYPSQDSYTHMGYPNTNFGSEPLFYILKGNVAVIVKSYLKFDLSSIPVGSIVSNAQLRLWVGGWGGESGRVSLYKITSDWQENSITWDNSPTVDTSRVIDSKIINSVFYYINFDITSLVQEWVNNPGRNYGLLISLGIDGWDPETSLKSFYFSSTQGDNPNARPCLIFSYITPTPTPTPTLRTQAFFQVKNCDVYAKNRVRSKVPSAVSYFINSTPGGIVSSGGLIDLGNALSVSPDTNWRLENYQKRITPTTFTYLKSLAKLIMLGEEKEFDPTKKEVKDLDSGIWYTKNDLEINTAQEVFGNKKLIIFVGSNTETSDLKISKNITIPSGDDSILVFIVSRNILIDPQVTEIHGIYYAAGLGESDPNYAGIHTGTKKTNIPSEIDSTLQVFGNLVAGPDANIKLERDLGEVLNQTTPAEIISCEPRYFLLFPPLIRYPIVSWQETAP